MTAAIEQLLSEVVADGKWCTGAFASARRCGAPLFDIAVGVDAFGTPLAPSDVTAIYCAVKPVTAVGVAVLVEADELSFDDQVGHILGEGLNPSLHSLTIDQLLTHRAGLWRYPAHTFLMLDRATRDAAIRSVESDPQSPSGVSAYAEFIGWELLRLVIEAITDRPFVEYINGAVLEPLGLSDVVHISNPRCNGSMPRVAVNVNTTRSRLIPLGWEQSTESLEDVNAATGAYATIAGLADFYCELLSILDGVRTGPITSETLRSMTRPHTQLAADRVLRRSCQFGRGFMVDLARHGFSQTMSSASFGHTGLNGMTFAAGDPETQIAFAVHLNAITDIDDGANDPVTSPLLRRQLLCDRLVRSLVDTC